MNILRPKCYVTAFLLFACFAFGCSDRAAAKRRAINALNSPKVLVRNGQSAILKMPEGYISIVLTTDWNHVSYIQKFSRSGDFFRDATAEVNGILTNRTLLMFHGAQVWIGDGDADSTWVALHHQERIAGIALSEKVTPHLPDTKRLQFRTNRPPDARDVGKSIGVQ